MKYLSLLAVVFPLFFSFAQAEEKRDITFGATTGDFSDIVTKSLKPQLEKKGYKITLVQFSDYIQPNIALNEKRLDVNIFQHKPYLEQFLQRKPMALTPLINVPTAPLGIYAGKKKSLNEVGEGSIVSVPNDPTNLARALQILADLHWIELKEGVDLFRASPKDITSNPRKIKIIQLEAAQNPRALKDVDYAVINGNYVVSAGMKVSSALAHEKSIGYLNWAVVRTEDKDSQFVQDVKEALRSPEFKEWANKKFAGYKFPADW